ncbi:unnamed protein product, partial [Amoebophrya sp. A25]
FFIDTSSCATCGTSGAVYMRIGSGTKQTGYKLLKKGFSPGSRTEMDIYAEDVGGKVEYLTLASHTPDNWMPRRVFLENNEIPGSLIEFPAAQRLGEPNNPELTIYPEMEEAPSES